MHLNKKETKSFKIKIHDQNNTKCLNKIKWQHKILESPLKDYTQTKIKDKSKPQTLTPSLDFIL